jgi:DHA1 family inner membrane transport protein
VLRKLWPLVLSAVALGINSYVIAGILPDIAATLDASQGAVGLGVTTFTAAYALTAPWLPGVLTRAGTTRRALLIALAVFVAGSALTAASGSLWMFLASRALAGAGAGVLTALATGAAGIMVPERSGRAMAMVTFGLSLGTVAGVPVGMLIAGRIGWRATMTLIVALGLIGLIALAIRGKTIPDLPRRVPADERNPFDGKPRGASGVLVGGVVLAFLLGIASLGLYTYLLPVASDAGLGGWGFALVWAWGIGGVAGSWTAGRLLDRFGGRRLLLVSPLLLTAAFATLWLTHAPAAWLIAAVIWGAAGWASVAIGQGAFTAVRPERSVQIVAWLMAAMYTGSATGSALGTALLSASQPAAILPAWTLIASGGALVLALITTLALRHRPMRSSDRTAY